MDPRQVERLIAEQFRLVGEDVIRISTGRIVDLKSSPQGYKWVRIANSGRTCCAYHRIKFFLIHGFMPDKVDHKSRIRADNSRDNLRAATSSENSINRPRRTRPLPKGVSYDQSCKRRKRYLVAFMFQRKRHYVGRYLTVEEASKAAEDFMKKHHGDFYVKPEGD
jgi:hypothetical protein